MSQQEPVGYAFDTDHPVKLYVENGSGSIVVAASDRTRTDVRLTGAHAGEATVVHDGEQISVLAPKSRSGFLGGDHKLDIEVLVPTDSHLNVRSGSAEVTGTGRLATARIKCGSGDVSLDHVVVAAVIDTGSGDVVVGSADGELRIRSGSGDVSLDRVAGSASISTGSGDVRISRSSAPVVVKTGSGDLEILEADGDVASTTGSGDVVVRSAHRGRISANGASGDILVGVPAGTAVWTDITTITGRVTSTLPSVGEPEPGSDHVELRATTVSGDIALMPG